MSYFDLETMTIHQLIAQFVSENMPKGQFLPYEDYQLIDVWVSHVTESDQLLLILQEIFDQEKFQNIRSIKQIHRLVMRKIKDH